MTDFTSFFESCVPSAIASINWVLVIFAMSKNPLNWVRASHDVALPGTP